MPEETSIYFIRTVKDAKPYDFGPYTEFPSNEWFVEFDGDDFRLLQEIVSGICWAERQLMPFAASICAACFKVKVGEAFTRSCPVTVLYPQKAIVDASEGYTGIIQPTFDYFMNPNGSQRREDLPPVLIGNIGQDMQPMLKNSTSKTFQTHFGIEIVLPLRQGRPKKIAFMKAVNLEEVSWDVHGKISVPASSHLLKVRFPAFKKTMRYLMPFMSNVRWNKDGILERHSDFTNEIHFGSCTDFQAINAKRAYFPEVGSIGPKQRILACREGLIQHRKDCTLQGYNAEYNTPKFNGILTILTQCLDAIAENPPSVISPFFITSFRARANTRARLSLINYSANYKSDSDFYDFDRVLDFYESYLELLLNTCAKIKFEADKRANREIAAYDEATHYAMTFAERKNLYFTLGLRYGIQLYYLPYVSFDEIGKCVNTLMGDLCYFERQTTVKRKKRPAHLASSRSFVLTQTGKKAVRKYQPHTAIDTVAKYRPALTKGDAYSFFVPMSFDTRVWRSDYMNELLSFQAEPVPTPQALEERTRRFKWDNTIHALDPEQEDAEAVAMLEEVEERAKIGERFIYRIVQLYTNSKGIPTPPGWIVNPIARRVLDEINPNDVPPNLAGELALSFANAQTQISVKGIPVFSPVKFAQLCLKIKNGQQPTLDDLLKVAAI